MYDKTTHSVRITVEPQFLDDRSKPDEGIFFWAYTIEIENRGTERVQLISRFWRIANARGQVQEVAGPGVVGKQPILDPGESFTYTSGAPLDTPSGMMMGHYHMETGAGEGFKAEIPAFSLDCPYGADRVH